MARKRPSEYDYICIRCGCPCDQGGNKHIGGGQDMKACNRPPHVMLRSDFEDMIRADIAAFRESRTLGLPAEQSGGK